MNDEACPNYEDLIENFTIGHRFVKDNFGVKPRIGWQLDTFGHSNTNIRLFAEMGFDAFFSGRMDTYDKNNRMQRKSLEWIHRPYSKSLGIETQIFGHQFDGELYRPPKGFDFDVRGEKYKNPDWINDNSSAAYNAPTEATKLIQHLR